MPTYEVDSTLPSVITAWYHNRDHHRPDFYSACEFFIRLGARPIKDLCSCFEIDNAESFIATESDLENTDLNPDVLVDHGKLRYYLAFLTIHFLNLVVSQKPSDRYDIFEDDILIPRMPETTLHSAVLAKLSNAITKGISELGGCYHPDTDTCRVLARVEALGTGAIHYHEGLSCPDNQFGFEDETFSPVVLEVASSQGWGGKEGLARKLHNHIVGSDGETNMAIGLEIGRKVPRLSIWTPKIVSQKRLETNILLNRQPITRDDKEALDIYVKDLVSATARSKHFPGLDQTAKISIPFADIAELVERSKDCYEKRLECQRAHQYRYEKQEYVPPPRLTASNSTKNNSRLFLVSSYTLTRSFLTSSASKSVSAIYEPRILFPRSPAPLAMSRYQFPFGLGTRAGVSGALFLISINRSMPWVRRILR